MKIERGDISVALVLVAALAIIVSTVFWLTRSDDDYFPLFVRLDRVEGLDELTFTEFFRRLNEFAIELPPLRARGTDVLLLAQHFVKTLAARAV